MICAYSETIGMNVTKCRSFILSVHRINGFCILSYLRFIVHCGQKSVSLVVL